MCVCVYVCVCAYAWVLDVHVCVCFISMHVIHACVLQYASIITHQLYGHTHRDDFAILSNEGLCVCVYIYVCVHVCALCVYVLCVFVYMYMRVFMCVHCVCVYLRVCEFILCVRVCVCCEHNITLHSSHYALKHLLCVSLSPSRKHTPDTYQHTHTHT